ncbi:MAG: hypothetical protein AAFY36_19730, partial [Bacteroidota bacterium]
ISVSRVRIPSSPPSELLPLYGDAIAAYEDWRIVDPESSTPTMMIPVMKSEMALPLAKAGQREEAIEAVKAQLEIDRRAFEADPSRPINREYVIFSLDNAIPVYDALNDIEQACGYASELIDLSNGYETAEQKTTNIVTMTENAKTRLADY